MNFTPSNSLVLSFHKLYVIFAYWQAHSALLCCYLFADQLACTTGAVRLAGGTSPANGRVEVCINGFWTSLCSVNFDTVEANIVCAEVGHQGLGARVRYGAPYGQGAGPVVGTFNCQGDESSLHDCYHFISSSCSSRGIGVECEGKCTVY